MLRFVDVRLSIPARLALIGSLFIVPIVFLTYIFLQQASIDISFAQKEIDGTRYLTRIWPLFAKTGLTGEVAQGEIPDRAQFDAEFGTADASRAFAEAKDAQAKLDAGKTLIGAVADGSNLTLDPDLDSFYAMDAATVRIPGIATAAVALGQAVAEPAASSARIVHIAFAVDHLQTSSDDAAGSLGSAMKGNAAGDTAKALAGPAAALKTATDAALEEGRALLEGREAKDLAGAEAALLAQVDAIWVPTNAEVARLLQARIDGFYFKIERNLAFAGLFLAIATVLSFTIARGLAGRLSGLVAAMDRLVAEDIRADIPYLGDRNETGRIAAALDAFKRALIERSTLRTDQSLAAELAVERRRNEEARAGVARRQLAVVHTVAENLGRLARADLTVAIQEPFSDEFDRLRVDLNSAAEQLRLAMGDVASTALTIKSGCSEISTAVDDLQARTERHAASLEQTAAALNEITATVKMSAEGAVQARKVVEAADGNAKRGAAVVAQAVKAMAGIAKASEQISPIIGLMDEIAFQTNLLALNAGVEAARAGEAGRGFAVVASEVRALAQRSAEAAKEIKGLISASTTQVDLGVKLVAETGTSLELIMAQVAEINGAVGDMATRSKEQAIVLDEINVAINQMDQNTQENAAMVQESSSACRAQVDEAEHLERLIGRFQIAPPSGSRGAPRDSIQNGDAGGRRAPPPRRAA